MVVSAESLLVQLQRNRSILRRTIHGRMDVEEWNIGKNGPRPSATLLFASIVSSHVRKAVYPITFMIEPESQFKLVLVGDAKTGKTTLMTRYLNSTYSSSYVPTVGADFKIKCIASEQPGFKLQVWDTGGESCCADIPESVIRNTQAVMICYDVSSRASFRNVTKWLKQTQTHSAVDCIVYILGCKSDAVYSRCVAREEGEQLARDKKCHFEEVSAKKQTNVEKVFKDVATLMKKQLEESSVQNPDLDEAGLTRRSTTTEANAKVQQGSYPIQISGACTWVNASKINGRYVPRITKLHKSDAVEEFCYLNIDCAGSVMVYRDNHWRVQRGRKEMACLQSPSIQCFPDVASLRSQWSESGGVYFTWMHLQPHIRCTALSPMAVKSLNAAVAAAGAGSGGVSSSGGGAMTSKLGGQSDKLGGSSHGSYTTRSSFSGLSVTDRESLTGGPVTLRRTISNLGLRGSGSSHGSSGNLNTSSHGDNGGAGAGLGDTIFASALRGMGGTLDMTAFAECLKSPEQQLGLSLGLFASYMRLRLALLEHEYRSVPNNGNGGWESAALVHITAQTQRIHEHCGAALHKAGLGDAGPTDPTVDAILLSGRAFLRQLSKHLAGLCGVERGAFDLARRCRDVKVQVEGFLNDLSPEYTSRASFSYSMSGRGSSFSGPAGGVSPRSPTSAY